MTKQSAKRVWSISNNMVIKEKVIEYIPWDADKVLFAGIEGFDNYPKVRQTNLWTKKS